VSVKRGCVLIVDDVDTNLIVAREALLSFGLRVDTAGSGPEAIEKIKRGAKYDIVFMDYMMPGMDGMETVKILRGTGYREPIVALTADTMEGQSEVFLANGFDGYVAKPIEVGEINSLFDRMIHDKKLPAMIKELRGKNSGSAFPAGEAGIDADITRFFLLEAEKALSVLDELYAKLRAERDFSRDEDMKRYITTVHGIKSSLVNIGETELSAAAHKLEAAGREGNVQAVLCDTASFTAALRTLMARIKPKDHVASGLALASQDLDYLRGKLLVIEEACALFDIITSQAALDELKRSEWPLQIDDGLDTIAAHLLHSAFKKAAETAKAMIAS